MSRPPGICRADFPVAKLEILRQPPRYLRPWYRPSSASSVVHCLPTRVYSHRYVLTWTAFAGPSMTSVSQHRKHAHAESSSAPSAAAVNSPTCPTCCTRFSTNNELVEVSLHRSFTVVRERLRVASLTRTAACHGHDVLQLVQNMPAARPDTGRPLLGLSQTLAMPAVREGLRDSRSTRCGAYAGAAATAIAKVQYQY